MSHVAESTLMTYLDGELPGRESAAVEAHLQECPACAAELEELRTMARETSAALALLDSPIPMLAARARIEDQQRAESRTITLSPWRRRRSTGFLKAAAVILLLASGAAAAIPGTPLNRLAGEIARLASRVVFGEPDTTPAPQDTPAPPVVQAPAPTLEWRVSPENNRVRVTIRGMEEGRNVTVRLYDDSRIRVSAPDQPDVVPAARSGAGFLELSNVKTELVIELPRQLARATVEIDGVTYYTKNGDDVRILQAAQDVGNDEYIFTSR